MLRTFGLASLFIMSTGSAYAGCWVPAEHPDQPTPHVNLCYAGKCEDTALKFSCSNAHGGQTGYVNGWHIEIKDDPRSIVVSRFGKIKDPKKLTCTGESVDRGCWFYM